MQKLLSSAMKIIIIIIYVACFVFLKHGTLCSSLCLLFCYRLISFVSISWLKKIYYASMRHNSNNNVIIGYQNIYCLAFAYFTRIFYPLNIFINALCSLFIVIICYRHYQCKLDVVIKNNMNPLLPSIKGQSACECPNEKKL